MDVRCAGEGHLFTTSNIIFLTNASVIFSIKLQVLKEFCLITLKYCHDFFKKFEQSKEGVWNNIRNTLKRCT